MNIRNQSIARQDEQIQQNVVKIEEKKARASALELMAARLSITPGRLQSTLISTVFKGAKEEEFAALIVVANELGLNPLKKEIYAFPTRGGVTPMIAYDGWVTIANNHPEFNGSEQNDIFMEGQFVGVETIIHRKDRAYPVKKMIYYDEFKMNTDPWKSKPRHMTALRSYCHAVRLAIGVSGVLVEEDYATIDAEVGPAVMPTSRQLQRQSREPEPAYDADTGEIADDAEADAAIEREAARLSGQGDDNGDADEPDSTAMIVKQIIDELAARKTVPDINSMMASDGIRSVMSDIGKDAAAQIEAAKSARIAEIQNGGN